MRVMDHLANRLNEKLPANPEDASIYQGLSAAWAVGAFAMAEITIKAVETGHPIADPQTALGTVATLAALGGSIILNDRAIQSRAEQ